MTTHIGQLNSHFLHTHNVAVSLQLVDNFLSRQVDDSVGVLQLFSEDDHV